MKSVLFENARLFDGCSRELPEGMSVLVEGNRITGVSERPIHSPGSKRIDCRGRTLMPGLIDAHVHIYVESLHIGPPEPPMTYRAQYAQKFLRHMQCSGFTTVRDVAGGDHGMAMALRDGFLEGPRYFYGGLCLSQTGGHGDFRPPHASVACCECGANHNAFAVIADGVDACIKATREELRKGAHHIKIMASGGVMSPSDPLDRSQYSESEIRAIVEECSRHGAYVAAHCHPKEAIKRCVEWGVRSIEHGTMIDEPTAHLVAERGAFVVPTMATIEALREEGMAHGMSGASLEKISLVADTALGGLEIMHRAGVKMGFGSDLLGPHHVRQGTEFTIRRRALPAWEILHSATAVNAELLGMKGQLGVVTPGALADLLVVDGDPVADIAILAANGAHLPLIMQDGNLVKCAV